MKLEQSDVFLVSFPVRHVLKNMYLRTDFTSACNQQRNVKKKGFLDHHVYCIPFVTK